MFTQALTGKELDPMIIRECKLELRLAVESDASRGNRDTGQLNFNLDNRV